MVGRRMARYRLGRPMVETVRGITATLIGAKLADERRQARELSRCTKIPICAFVDHLQPQGFWTMLRIVVCSASLIALIAGVRFGLRNTFDAWGFGWGAAIGIGGMIAILVTAHLIDRADTRSQEVLPPKPHDYR
jgi:hypothetical protein